MQVRDRTSFVMNGYLWRIIFVKADSPLLVDRTGEQRVATTDPSTLCIYLSNELSGGFLKTVLMHELGHVTMFSYGLLETIHSFCKPARRIEAEEWVCNFIADYSEDVIFITNHVLSPLPRRYA